MNRFSRQSEANLTGVHPVLVDIARRALRVIDFSVVEGVRTAERQKELYDRRPRVTRCDGVHKRSAHQTDPESGYGHALDLYPWPIDATQKMDYPALDKAHTRFGVLAGVMMGVWSEGDYHAQLVWGGSWDGSLNVHNNGFDDLPHFELRI